MFFCASWTVDVDGIVCFCCGIGLEQSGQAEDVITMPVADADVGDFGDADAGNLELPLCPFAAIKEDALSFV